MNLKRILHLIAFGSVASLIACGVVDQHIDPDQNGKADNPVCSANEISFDCPPQMPSYNSVLPDGIKENVEGPPTDAPIPAKHSDLVQYQSAVKSQGSRGVCSIFANIAYMEHLYLKAKSIYGAGDPALAARFPDDFSEQYLQWSVKFQENSFPHSSGSNASYNLRAIAKHGITEESAWPYETFQWGASNDERCTGEESQMPTECFTNGHPTQTAKDAPKYKLPSAKWLSSRQIKSHIVTNGTAVVLGMDFFYQSWNHRKSNLVRNQAYWDKGYVLFPNEEDLDDSSGDRRAGHGILIVGWDDTLEVAKVDKDGKHTCTKQGALPQKIAANTPCDEGYQLDVEKGFYVFKNSWGTGNFGKNNPHGDGFGFISMEYIHQYASSMVADLPDPSMLPGIAPDPQPTAKSFKFEGSVDKDHNSEIQRIDIGEGAKNVRVVMSGTGDPDLYVNYGDAAINFENPDRSSCTCVPYESGAEESCDTALNPAGGSELVVFVRGFEDSSIFKVQVTWE